MRWQMTNIRKEESRIIEEILHSSTDDFVALVQLAGLDPSTDFRFADFAGIDFGDADLRGYDFTGANLENANLSGALFDKTLLEQARLRGAKLPASYFTSQTTPADMT